MALDWLGLSSPLAWQLWRAIVRAKWTASVQWRDQFLTLSRQHPAPRRAQVGDVLGELGTLPTLVALIEGLMAEKTLLGGMAGCWKKRCSAWPTPADSCSHRTAGNNWREASRNDLYKSLYLPTGANSAPVDCC
jgi:hypothetical protein